MLLCKLCKYQVDYYSSATALCLRRQQKNTIHADCASWSWSIMIIIIKPAAGITTTTNISQEKYLVAITQANVDKHLVMIGARSQPPFISLDQWNLRHREQSLQTCLPSDSQLLVVGEYEMLAARETESCSWPTQAWHTRRDFQSPNRLRKCERRRKRRQRMADFAVLLMYRLVWVGTCGFLTRVAKFWKFWKEETNRGN